MVVLRGSEPLAKPWHFSGAVAPATIKDDFKTLHWRYLSQKSIINCHTQREEHHIRQLQLWNRLNPNRNCSRCISVCDHLPPQIHFTQALRPRNVFYQSKKPRRKMSYLRILHSTPQMIIGVAQLRSLHLQRCLRRKQPA